MFNLESAIADWREQMLRAGIKAPAPLEELESHLREEIRQQQAAGLSDHAAFASATLNLGQPRPLGTEFKKADDLLSRLTGPTETRVERLLAFGWLIYCLGSIYSIANRLYTEGLPAIRQQDQWKLFLLTILTGYIYARCAEASLHVLFNSTRRQAERRILWFLAMLEVCGAGTMIGYHMFPMNLRPIAFAVLGLLSLWLLRPTFKPRAA